MKVTSISLIISEQSRLSKPCPSVLVRIIKIVQVLRQIVAQPWLTAHCLMAKKTCVVRVQLCLRHPDFLLNSGRGIMMSEEPSIYSVKGPDLLATSTAPWASSSLKTSFAASIPS
jgi:hypothetical protein